MVNFSYKNIEFKKHATEKWFIITGEIINNSGRNFNAVVFRIILFIKNIPVGNTVITINGFYAGQTRTFETQIGELDYRIIPEITRCEIYAESTY